MPVRSDWDRAHFEPNWREVERVHSWLGWFDDSAYAFLDRWGYKAADNRDCNQDYEFLNEWEQAYEEGYLIADAWNPHRVWTKEDYDEETDPTYGMDPVTHGPYFIDQGPSGHFSFQGPRVYAPGPRPPYDWKPAGCTDDYWYDRSLWFMELAP